MTVLVTGATGFVGSHVVARLVDDGTPVRVLVRDPAKLARVPAIADAGVLDVVQGDVTDAGAVERAVDGAAGVVHSAARVSLSDRDAAAVHDVNVGGSRR